MNPLTYVEISTCTVLYTIYSMLFRLGESSHLFRNIHFFLFCIHSVLCYFDINESSHLCRNIPLFRFLFWMPSILCYFNLNESSHLCQNSHMYRFVYILFYAIPGRWILSLIPRYPLLLILFTFCSMLFRYKWILSLIPKRPLVMFRIHSILWHFRYKWVFSLIPK